MACDSGVNIVDVSNPSSWGTVPPTPISYAVATAVNEVRVSGTTAYLAAGSSGLIVLDVTTPALPVLVDAYATGMDARDVQVIGTVAYVADGANGLKIFDVSALLATGPDRHLRHAWLRRQREGLGRHRAR